MLGDENCWCCGGTGTKFSMVFGEYSPCSVCRFVDYTAWLSGPHPCVLCRDTPGWLKDWQTGQTTRCYGCDGTGMSPPTKTAQVVTPVPSSVP